VLLEEVGAIEARSVLWQNGARPASYVRRPVEAPKWTPETIDRFKEQMAAVHGGPRSAGKTAVLEDGMEWLTLALSPDQQQYIEGRKFTLEEVGRVYGLMPRVLGLIEGGEDEASHRHFYQDVLGPRLRMMQDEIELQLLPDFELVGRGRDTIYVEFNISEKLKGSFEEQTKALTTAVGVPHLTVNEARAMQNRPRIDDDDFDKPVKPANVIYGNQPSTQIPTADPSTPPSVQPNKPTPRSLRAVASLAEKADSEPPRAVVARRDAAAGAYERIFRSHFGSLETAVLGALARKDISDAAGIFEQGRWDDQLGLDLLAESIRTTNDSGTRAAAQVDGVYDPDIARPWVAASATGQATEVNDWMRRRFLAALHEDEPADAVRHLFEVAKTADAERLGLGRATNLINWSRVEAARQSTEKDGVPRTKTWVVTSGSRSRHPQLNGATVAYDGAFGNGARWPGDVRAGQDETAGCHCLLRVQ
jgi:hypothetical protein